MMAPDSLEDALQAGSETAIKAWLANVVSLVDWDDQDALDELAADLTSALAAAVREWIKRSLPPPEGTRTHEANEAVADVARRLKL